MNVVQLTPMQEDLEPEGWLGDPEWPPLFIGRGNSGTVYVYAEVDMEEGVPYLLSALPDLGRHENYMTWLEYEVTINGSFCELIEHGHDCITSEEDWLTWCLENGLCPGQWFVVRLTPRYSSWYDYQYGGMEYDFSCDYEIISAEQLSPEEHLERWMTFFDEWARATDGAWELTSKRGLV